MTTARAHTHMILKPFDVNCLAIVYSLISIMHQTEEEKTRFYSQTKEGNTEEKNVHEINASQREEILCIQIHKKLRGE